MSTAPVISPDYPRGIAKVGYSLDLPADYYVKETRSGCTVHWDGYGQIGDEFDSYAAACFFAQEHDAEAKEEAAALDAEQAEDDAAEAAEQAATAAQAALIASVSDFIWAADRGRFGSALRCDDAESAYLTDLRNKLVAFQIATITVETLR